MGRYVAKEIAGEFLETFDTMCKKIVTAAECADELNAKDAEIERLKAIIGRQRQFAKLWLETASDTANQTPRKVVQVDEGTQ